MLQKYNNIPVLYFCYAADRYPLGSLPSFNLLGSDINYPSALEYARRCGNPSTVILSFLPYKIQFCRPCCDAGLIDLTFQYFESIVTCSVDMIRDDSTADRKIFREQLEIL